MIDNLIPLWVNVARAVEIALLGNYSITLYYDNDNFDFAHNKMMAEDYDLIKNFYKDVDFREDGDLLVEMHIRNKIGKNVRYETLAEIKDRVNIAKKNEIPTEFDSESCMILLDNAVVRNTMSYVRYKKAIEIAGIIAQLDNTKTIKVEHMVEAIQYSILYCTGGYNNLNTNTHNFGYGITIKNSKLKNSDIENAIEYLQSLL